MKTIAKTLLLSVALLVSGCATTTQNGSARQLYAPIDRIYTVDEARNLSLYKRLAGEGVPVAALEQPGAFVETYSDTVMGFHKFHRTAYIPPALRQDIRINTIVAVNRYDHSAIVNAVVPRTQREAYACVERNALEGIAACAESAVTQYVKKY